MKKLLLITLLLPISFAGFCQNAYYDAIKLKSAVVNGRQFDANDTNTQLITDVLSQYVKLPIGFQYTFANIKNEIGTDLNPKNPFLASYMSNPGSSDISASSFSTSLSSFGSTNVTNFADGLAKFLVERSKEELNVAFFSKFQKYLDDFTEVKTVFPSTAAFLGLIKSYQYNDMLPALKAAFKNDLNDITSNLLKLRKLDETRDCSVTDTICIKRLNNLANFFKKPEGRSVIASLIVADNLVKGNDAATLIENLANDDIFTSHSDENLSNVVQFIVLISNSLRSEEDDRVWITKKQINDLIKDEVTFKIYLGLLYALDAKSSNPISFKIDEDSVSLQKVLKDLADNWGKLSGEFKSSFKTLANAASDVSDNAKNIATSKASGEQSTILIYADYTSSISTFLKGAVTFIENNKIDTRLAKLTTDTKKFIEVIDHAVDACYDIKSQNYSALILHTSLILTDVLNDKDFPLKEKYIKYGTFMANIVEAKNSDEVKSAIEAAVLPVGSASIKRETDVNISLNAYIGGYAGAENMQSLETNKTAFSAGLTAPVGLAFSWGNKFKCNKDKDKKLGGKSITLFVPVIDVGVLASYRINDSQTAIASNIELKNIVSPGLYLYFGFGKCPISLGVGAQLGTQIRSIDAGVPVIDNDNIYLRYGISLVVDIPLLNFYTRNDD